MISVKEAKKIILKSCSPLASTDLSLKDSLGFALAENTYSPIHHPPFLQSAMDGYAIRLHSSEKKFTLVGESKAGNSKEFLLKNGEAIRIFTGAPVPETADAIVMQEKVKTNQSVIEIESLPQKGENIRKVGEQIKKGETALHKGTTLNPGAIGFLSGLGIEKVSVTIKPQVNILVTGDELVEAGKTLTYGQIYESNSITLRSALYSMGVKDVHIEYVKDNYSSTLSAIKTSIENNHITLISGGISVGDYDFVGQALAELKVEKLFYKVKQKPGKPLFFGKKHHRLVFALPGNPAAALTCFYEYMVPAIHLLSGKKELELPKLYIPFKGKTYLKKGDYSQFLKALFADGCVQLLDGQASSMLSGFAQANAIIYMDEQSHQITDGDLVEVHLLP